MTENEIKWLCISAKECFMKQPNFLELASPINVVGMKKNN